MLSRTFRLLKASHFRCLIKQETIFSQPVIQNRRSRWPSGLQCLSVAAHLLGFRVRILSDAWMLVYYTCCTLSDRGLCDGLIPRPEESYRLWCVVVCDLETSQIRRLRIEWGRRTTRKYQSTQSICFGD